MKLLAKYNRINLLGTISVLLISSICFYFMIRHVLINQLDEDLEVEEQEIINFVKINNKLPDPFDYEDQQIEFAALNSITAGKKFSSLMRYNKADNKDILTRQYQFTIAVAGKNYLVFIRKSQEETEDLVRMIVTITLGAVVFLLLVLFLVNRFVLSRLWQPFNSTLTQVKHFNLSAKNELNLQHTSTTEFIELNKTILVMTDRVKKDYETLKNFSDNASHEMQTPLAVINSKLDVLIQDEFLTEFQMQQLQGIYNALDRLSHLNQSLLLLTKIENKQFNEEVKISLDELIKEKLFEFEELIDSKKISVTTDLQPASTRGNRQLIDILINNLLINAIRYNVQHGNIFIKLAADELSISNSSFLPALDEQGLFQRFYRHADTRQDGNGLGLSIAKQICTVMGYEINYRFQDSQHKFCICFGTKKKVNDGNDH